MGCQWFRAVSRLVLSAAPRGWSSGAGSHEEGLSVIATEACRERRLRRAAMREGRVFKKLRHLVLEGGMQVLYMMADDHNHIVGMWETLDQAEADLAED